jgi:exodeoxyribonuclease V beta subunit
VQIVTVHASKGLEFPVVCLPYAWDGATNPNVSTLLLHGSNGERILDIGGKSGPGFKDRHRIHDAEAAGEELRLTYVALTRAMCQVIAWWAPGAQTSGAPLHRLLMGRGGDDPEPSLTVKVPGDAVVARQLSSWAAGAPDAISAEPVDAAAVVPARWRPPDQGSGELAAARFDRTLDALWRRTSYSALTTAVHDAPAVGSEAEQAGKTDETDSQPTIEQQLTGPPSPMNDLPAGAAFGTLVHEVLEVVDTSAADLPAELLLRCQEAVSTRLATLDPAALATALLPVMQTPLGFGSLATIASRDRLTELDFELPLAGGDHPAGHDVTLTRLAASLREHVPTDDPLAGYADLLDTVDAAPLRGYLAGSIDAVLRIPGPRYVIVDYKTNRLARGELTALHYTRDKMAAEMLRAHYPLQALLYEVALHRYLRWRQPGYDPARHLGGVRYLFVRGMVGTATPAGCGVFDWDPPSTLITSLSDLLAGS